jgi:hypothetical protein
MRISDATLTGTAFDAPGLPPGFYHWRVAALDAFGLPGAWSASRRFERIDDRTPPFILVTAPAADALIDTATYRIEGETEPGAAVTIAGVPVPVDAGGRFARELTATPGENTAVIEATDPAGNQATRTVAVLFRPAQAVRVALDPSIPQDADGTLLTAGDTLALSAETDAAERSAVVVTGPAGAEVLRAVVEGGRISVTLPAAPERAAYALSVLAPTGAVEATLAIALRQDSEPPVLRLDAPPLPATATAALRPEGLADGASTLTLDGAPVALSADGRFAADVTLTPGPNTLAFRATDAVGNTALLTLSTVLDTEPPEVLAARATRGPTGVEIAVTARDATGLRAVARYEITRAGRAETGVMRCDAASGECRAVVPADPGPVALVSATVEDYAGNARRSGPTR